VIACTDGPIWAVRATTLGLMVGALSVLGHAMSPTHGLSATAILSVMGVAVLAAFGLTAARLTVVRVGVFAVTFQVVAHFLLSRMSAHPHTSHAAGSHQYNGRYPLVELVEPAPLVVDPVMLATHAAAGVLIMVLILRAESALFGFADALTRTAQVIFGGLYRLLPAQPVTTPQVAVEATITMLVKQWHVRHVRRRGPPLWCRTPTCAS
jgi:hypothetical protein